MSNTAKVFFDEIASEYDDVFRKWAFRLPEMLQTMFDYLPEGFKPARVLELGCGTGKLTKVISQVWPDCEITAIDVSGPMLEKVRQNVNHSKLITLETSFADVDFEPGSFDLVTSSLAIHHLRDPEKIALIQKIHRWLSPGGIFMFNDGVRAQSERLYKRAEKQRIEHALSLGLTSEQIAPQLQHHRDHDHYPVLIDLVNWLRDAGFREVDILWRFAVWAVLCGTK